MHYDTYRPPSFYIIPYVIKNLIFINAILFVATLVFERAGIDLTRYLGLFNPRSADFQPYQFITHMFMHGGLAHLFFNMFALWMFGTPIERVWGPRRFLFYYFITGLGAALLHTAVNYNQPFQYWTADGTLASIPTVGASGAVYGVLLAFGMLYPNTLIYFYFFLPIRAKYFVILYGAIELYYGFVNAGSNVAHFAHLGGMLFGYFLIKYWRRPPEF